MENLKLLINLINIHIKNNFRNPQKLLYLIFFSFIVVIIFAFSFDLNKDTNIYSGIIWSVIIFSSTNILSDSFKEESDNNIFYRYKLSSVSLSLLLISRMLSNIIIITIWEILIIFLEFIFLNINHEINLWFIVTIILGTIGYVVLSTFFSLLISGEKNIFTAIIIYPLILPLIMGLLKMTSMALKSNITEEYFFWLKITGGFNVIYLSLIIILTEITEE